MTEDYVSLYIHSALAQEDPTVFFSLFFLFLGRILPIIALVPFFGAKVLPHPVKVVFGICLFGLFLPQLMHVSPTPIAFDMNLINLFLKELFIGLLIGFFLSMPFMIVQNAGIMIDHQRGGASLMVNDPTVQTQSSPLGTLFNLILVVLFYRFDGPFIVLEIIRNSFTNIPPDQFLDASIFRTDSVIVKESMKLMGQLMIISTQLAAPALLIILMTDFFLGIANRLAPQVQITFLGMPLKSLLALVIVFFGWQMFNEQIVKETRIWINYVFQLVDLLKVKA